MGCCLSSRKIPPPSKFRQHSSRAPPPVDVETVKEVLSETPNPKPFAKIEHDPRKTKQNPNKIRQEVSHNNDNLEDPNVSEISSTMSESVSTTTFNDDIDVYRQRVISRSPSKLSQRKPVSGELQRVGKSPVRGKEQSPGPVRLVPERNSRGTGLGSGGRSRPGSGNVSAARSRSPANRTVAGGGFGARNDIGRSPSSRRTGKSPGRVGSDLHERVCKPGFGSGREREDYSWPPTGTNDKESLENPLVALECFIFL